MTIPNLELSDDFSTWRDITNLSVNELNNASSTATANTIAVRDELGKITATEFVSTSSIAFKENITPINNVLHLINQMQPVKFDWKNSFMDSNDEKGQLGLIAEQIKDILPTTVAYDKEKNVYGIKYSNLIAVLIAGIQDLYNEISVLKNEKPTISSSDDLMIGGSTYKTMLEGK